MCLGVLLLTFTQMDRHAFRLEQTVVLSLGVARRRRRGGRGLCEWVLQDGRRRRGVGRGRVHLGVDGGHAGHGRTHELPAEAQQAAGDLVHVERSDLRH